MKKENKTNLKDYISKGYDEIAESIGLDKSFYRRVIGVAGKINGNILDVGCGQGFLLKMIHDKYPPVSFFGLDISNKLCHLSKKNNPYANIELGDAEDLPYQDGFFDFVFMTETLEHLLDYNKAINEVYRVLRKNGVFVVTVPNRDWLRYDFYDSLRDKKRQPIDDHYFRFKEIKNLLEKNNFKIVRYKGSDNLYYYYPYHKYEQFISIFLPFLNRKMKRLIFKCVKK